jgi:hypothetical protein
LISIVWYAPFVPLIGADGSLNEAQHGFRQVRNRHAEFGHGRGRIEKRDARNVILRYRYRAVKFAARGDGGEHAGVKRFGDDGIEFIVRERREVAAGHARADRVSVIRNAVRDGALHAEQQGFDEGILRSILRIQQIAVDGVRDRRAVFPAQFPKRGRRQIAVGVRYVEHVAEGMVALFRQQRDALRAPVDPSAVQPRAVPFGKRGERGGVGPLGVNKHLIHERALVVLSRCGKKTEPFAGISAEISHGFPA